MELDQTTKSFRVRKTVLEMLIDRGYALTEAEKNGTLDEFKAQFCDSTGTVEGEKMTITKLKVSDPTQKIMVFFPDEVTKVSVGRMKSYYDKMVEEHARAAIVVLRNGITSFARSSVARLAVSKEPCRIEFFQEDELLVNITKHQLVPQHILLSAEEKARVLARYKLKESQLPRITLNDPVAKYFGMARGDVVKIIRKSETAGRYVTYRLVI